MSNPYYYNLAHSLFVPEAIKIGTSPSHTVTGTVACLELHTNNNTLPAILCNAYNLTSPALSVTGANSFVGGLTVSHNVGVGTLTFPTSSTTASVSEFTTSITSTSTSSQLPTAQAVYNALASITPGSSISVDIGQSTLYHILSTGAHTYSFYGTITEGLFSIYCPESPAIGLRLDIWNTTDSSLPLVNYSNTATITTILPHTQLIIECIPPTSQSGTWRIEIPLPTSVIPTAGTGGMEIAVPLSVLSTTASTSTTTGAFLVQGGVGIGGNLNTNHIQPNISYITAAATTTTLTVSSAQIIRISGTQIHTIQLPNTTTLSNGHTFNIASSSTGRVTITNTSATTIALLDTNSEVIVRVLSNATNTWDVVCAIPVSISTSVPVLELARHILRTGYTDGVAITAGQVGEIIECAAFASDYNVTTGWAVCTGFSMELTAGVWLIEANLNIADNSGDALNVALSQGVNNTTPLVRTIRYYSIDSGHNIRATIPIKYYVSINSSQTFNVIAMRASGTSSVIYKIHQAATFSSQFNALRIA